MFSAGGAWSAIRSEIHAAVLGPACLGAVAWEADGVRLSTLLVSCCHHCSLLSLLLTPPLGCLQTPRLFTLDGAEVRDDEAVASPGRYKLRMEVRCGCGHTALSSPRCDCVQVFRLQPSPFHALGQLRLPAEQDAL